MNRFSVHYATNDSMTKAGNVRGVYNIFLLFNDCVLAELVTELHQKGKKIHYVVRERLDFTCRGSCLQEK